MKGLKPEQHGENLDLRAANLAIWIGRGRLAGAAPRRKADRGIDNKERPKPGIVTSASNVELKKANLIPKMSRRRGGDGALGRALRLGAINVLLVISGAAKQR
jgi:hypothetical protein